MTNDDNSPEPSNDNEPPVADGDSGPSSQQNDESDIGTLNDLNENPTDQARRNVPFQDWWDSKDLM